MGRSVGTCVSAYTCKGRIHIYDVNDFVANAASGDFARPAKDERSAERGLHCSEVGAAPGTAVAFPWIGCLGAVVAGEDDDGVVFDASSLDRIEDLAGAVVHLSEAVGPVAVAGLSGERSIWQYRHVNQ